MIGIHTRNPNPPGRDHFHVGIRVYLFTLGRREVKYKKKKFERTNLTVIRDGNVNIIRGGGGGLRSIPRV